MKERIKELRKFLNLNQTDFGDKIGVKQTTVAGYETGNRTPTDAVILSICREFDANEDWLRTGSGEMFISKTRNQIITDFAADLIKEEDTFKKRLIEALAKLDERDWEELGRLADKLAKKD